jgi:RNA polymerase sigma-70 factor, ECF subfamily
MPDSLHAREEREGDLELDPDGDPSFAPLVHQHQSKLCNFIYRYTRNRQDAEDLTQDTFVKAFKNFHRYDSRYAFSTWLYTIARRTVYNHYRSARPAEPIDYDIVSDEPSPDANAEISDRKESIWESAQRLKEEYQEVLALKYVEDLSVKEISKILNKTQTNVKILLFRARNQLKKIHKL